MLPPAAQPTCGVTKRTSRIGHGLSSVRSLHVAPPSVVRCTQPSTFGEISPPPTQPLLSSRKKVGPSNTGSTGGPHDHAAPPFALSQYVMPDARACPFASRLNSLPNQPPAGSTTSELQSCARAPPSIV